MRTISAKFASACKACGKPIMAGDEALYEDSTRKIYHPGCRPVEQPGIFAKSESVALATRLGYRTSEEWAVQERDLFLLREHADSGGPTGERHSPPGRDDLWPMPRSPESETE